MAPHPRLHPSVELVATVTPSMGVPPVGGDEAHRAQDGVRLPALRDRLRDGSPGGRGEACPTGLVVPTRLQLADHVSDQGTENQEG